jgi:hypothetical protein
MKEAIVYDQGKILSFIDERGKIMAKNLEELGYGVIEEPLQIKFKSKVVGEKKGRE